MERNTRPGEPEVQGHRPATGFGRFRVALQFKFRGCNRYRGSERTREIPYLPRVKETPAEGNTGRGFQSSELSASSRLWLVSFIKRKNFRFLKSFVFNDIGDF